MPFWRLWNQTQTLKYTLVILEALQQKKNILLNINNKTVNAVYKYKVVGEIKNSDELMFDLDSMMWKIQKTSFLCISDFNTEERPNVTNYLTSE